LALGAAVLLGLFVPSRPEEEAEGMKRGPLKPEPPVPEIPKPPETPVKKEPSVAEAEQQPESEESWSTQFDEDVFESGETDGEQDDTEDKFPDASQS
jgi:hypothetical protein